MEIKTEKVLLTQRHYRDVMTKFNIHTLDGILEQQQQKSILAKKTDEIQISFEFLAIYKC